jgi:serine/threonine-protein kinase
MSSDPQRYQQAKAIFHAALERTGAAREEYVRETCAEDPILAAEVNSLLRASDAAETDFLASGPQLARHAVADIGSLGADRGYRVVRELARGGMGVVYLAERADGEYTLEVAIKLLSHAALLQPEALLRLKLEREILARLNHPNIARLLDGGTTADGLPYLVMEYVDGERLDVWCKRRAPPVEERLVLFLAICDAVAYAHRNLVVHRDLKPANVLVTADDAPKLLDFGIAKLLAADASALTEEGARPMTPRYASPEQVLGKPVTTLSDVYSLGVVLYELLTDTTPYGDAISTPLSLPQVICERDPPPPSAQKLALRGDLDAITMRALRKAPEARYASVEALAEDLRAYLDGRPVAARHGERWYRARRFAQRHWRALATAAAVLLLVAGFVARLNIELAQTALERDKAQRVVAFFGDLFQVADPSEARGSTITVREVLERGARALDADTTLEPAVRAAMLEIIGTVNRRLGLLKQAEPLLERSVALRADLEPAGRVHALSALAALRIDQGKFAPAQALLDEAESLRSGLLAGDRALEARLALERQADLPAHRRAPQERSDRGVVLGARGFESAASEDHGKSSTSVPAQASSPSGSPLRPSTSRWCMALIARKLASMNGLLQCTRCLARARMLGQE